MSNSTKSRRQAALKEDVKHLLEELWDAEETDALHRIFARESRRGIQNVLLCSEEDLKDLFFAENDGTSICLAENEIGGIHMLVPYQ